MDRNLKEAIKQGNAASVSNISHFNCLSKRDKSLGFLVINCLRSGLRNTLGVHEVIPLEGAEQNIKDGDVAAIILGDKVVMVYVIS